MRGLLIIGFLFTGIIANAQFSKDSTFKRLEAGVLFLESSINSAEVLSKDVRIDRAGALFFARHSRFKQFNLEISHIITVGNYKFRELTENNIIVGPEEIDETSNYILHQRRYGQYQLGLKKYFNVFYVGASYGIVGENTLARNYSISGNEATAAEDYFTYNYTETTGNDIRGRASLMAGISLAANLQYQINLGLIATIDDHVFQKGLNLGVSWTLKNDYNKKDIEKESKDYKKEREKLKGKGGKKGSSKRKGSKKAKST